MLQNLFALVDLDNKDIQDVDNSYLKSHNKILFKGWKRKIYGKTGYTRAAKSCFLGTLQEGKDTLIVGVFGCTKRWEDIKYVVSRYGKISL